MQQMYDRSQRVAQEKPSHKKHLPVTKGAGKNMKGNQDRVLDGYIVSR
jgi:hypothetical protein